MFASSSVREVCRERKEFNFLFVCRNCALWQSCISCNGTVRRRTGALVLFWMFDCFDCCFEQLFDLVARAPKRRLKEPLAAEITRQLVRGVRYVHDQGYIHRDLK
jgi:serine/threonine protein kinase